MRRGSLLAGLLALCLLTSCRDTGSPHTAAPARSSQPSPTRPMSSSPTVSRPATTRPTKAPPAKARPTNARPTPTKTDGVAPGTGLTAFYATKAQWRPCTQASGAADFIDLRGYQCATVAVPLDYRHPAGRRLSISIARLPASGSHRIGSLVIDPGGPGASGLGYLTEATRAIPAAVRRRFDVVGLDPRGVGASAGLHCLSTAGFDAMVAAAPVPTTAPQVAAAVARATTLAAGCQSAAGWELPYLGTVYAARDLDLVRSAIGDQRLTYLGKSYGTLLGAVYADEFPTRVRALVLDGALPPGLDPAAQSRQQGAGFEVDLGDFLRDCSARTSCAVASTRRLEALLAGIAVHPLRTSSGRLLHAGEAMNGLSAALYSTASWPLLRTALRQAGEGDGTVLLELSDALAGRHAGGYETELGSFTAISCADVPATYTTRQAAAFARQWAVDSPLYGPLEAWGLLSCDHWPATASPLPAAVTGKGAAPIVVVGTTRDPATPYAWAQDLAGQLGSARLVTYDGDGHTVYGDGKSSCVDVAVNAYLIDRTPPHPGLRCAG